MTALLNSHSHRHSHQPRTIEPNSYCSELCRHCAELSFRHGHLGLADDDECDLGIYECQNAESDHYSHTFTDTHPVCKHLEEEDT